MAKETEPAKLLLPYLQRADELQKHEPLVAYYCRLYAMEKGLKIPQSERTKTTNALLISLMNQLEKDKKFIELGPEDNLYVEGFALNVFGKADKQDRAGRADLNIAKTFYAASIFFEILDQFGALQPDLEQKQKYAIWKAADIRKALKEGKKPDPGPPADEDLPILASTHPGEYNDLGPSQTTATSQPESDPSQQFHNQVNDHHSANSPPSVQFHEDGNNQHSVHIPPTPQFHDSFDHQYSSNILPSLPSYPTTGFTSHDFHPPPPASGSDNSTYSQPYHHQSYSHEPQQHMTHDYPSHETSSYSYSYPNFHSYPSFTDSSLPSAPSHYPSYNQGPDFSYTHQSAAPTNGYPSVAQHPSSSINQTYSDAAPTSTQTFQYDSNYQPPAEKIAEAHKSARFAVGALAFDDVSAAVDYLRKALELLTNPSAGAPNYDIYPAA